MGIAPDFASKIVRYVSTPMHSYTAICVGILIVLSLDSVPIIVKYVLTGLLVVIVFAVLLLNVFDHKKLQFTASEQIEWERERLGDSDNQRLYYAGDSPSPLGVPALSTDNLITHQPTQEPNDHERR